jgi:excisionase family DNA binding protein
MDKPPLKLLTISDLSELTAVSQKTIRNWIFRREIPFIKLNKKLIRFRLLDIEKWIASRSFAR